MAAQLMSYGAQAGLTDFGANPKGGLLLYQIGP